MTERKKGNKVLTPAQTYGVGVWDLGFGVWGLGCGVRLGRSEMVVERKKGSKVLAPA